MSSGDQIWLDLIRLDYLIGVNLNFSVHPLLVLAPPISSMDMDTDNLGDDADKNTAE